MGYTRIAGTPVITGLFTLLIPMALYAFLGSSRHLVVGADSATAAILAAGLLGIATVRSPEYVAYAGLLALIAGLMLIAANLARLSFLADFLSRTVLVGFLTGVGIQVGISQLHDMLGLTGHGLSPVQEILSDVAGISKTNPYSLTISIGALLIIFGLRKVSKKIPAALIAVLAAIILSYVFNLGSHLSVLGPVPSGLPKLGFPNAPLNWNILQELLSTAFSMFVVILAQSAATSRAYAARYNEEFSEEVDLMGLGIANLGAAFSGSFVVNGSPTKTEMVHNAGGRSQLSQLTTVCLVLATLLFLTGPLSYMPIAVLAAVVFVIAVELVNVKEMREIFIERPAEFWVATATAGIVVFVGVEQGIIVAMLLSLFSHTRHGYKPSNSLVTVDDQGVRQLVPVASGAQFLPGLIIYRFDHSMYYANAEFFRSEVLGLTSDPRQHVAWFCLDGSAIDDVDFTAAATLREICGALKQRGIRLVLVRMQDRVRAELDRSKITALVGVQYIFKTIHELEDVYKQSPEGTVRETPPKDS
jgi:high affinity sulfate transporter 1